MAHQLHCLVLLELRKLVQGMSLTTLRRRKHKSLETLSKGKGNVDQLLMQASQVYSATSHWQSQVDAADFAKQEAVGLLGNVKDDLQVLVMIIKHRRLHSKTLFAMSP